MTALDHADFDLYEGEILAVIGDNGAGKSSLIRALSGALAPDAGEIRLADRPVAFRSPLDAQAAGIETVYQTLALSPSLSIADNMFLGRELRRAGPLGTICRMLDRKAMQRIAREKLTELGLMTVQSINQRVETLSGGQRQGVARGCGRRVGGNLHLSDRRSGGHRDGEVHPARLRREGADRGDRAHHRDHARQREAANAELNGDLVHCSAGAACDSTAPAARQL